MQKSAAMEWSDLKFFLAAVRAGSYTVASRQLKVNRTTVGRRIGALEAAVGQSLFEDTPLGHRPTPAGVRLLHAAEAIEKEIEAMMAQLAAPDGLPTSVRVAGSLGVVSEFLPEFAAFQRAHPAISIELLSELDPIGAVTYRRADLAIALIRTPPTRLTGLQVATLRQARYALRGSGDLPMIGWGDEVEAALPGGHWLAANRAEEGGQARGAPSCNSWPQLKQAVLAGLGSAELWCFVADRIAELDRLSPPDPRNDCPLWLLRHARTPPSASLTLLMDFLSSALPARIDRNTEKSYRSQKGLRG